MQTYYRTCDYFACTLPLDVYDYEFMQIRQKFQLKTKLVSQLTRPPMSLKIDFLVVLFSTLKMFLNWEIMHLTLDGYLGFRSKPQPSLIRRMVYQLSHRYEHPLHI